MIENVVEVSRHCGVEWKNRGDVFKILIGKHTGKRTLERLGRRWEDNFRMYLKEIGVNTRNSVDRDY